ncbi:hypothetical protein D1AOALGA4SA_5118 [Olavius algarvensis Delta 1 endosymbiont]|nr:hypothetical protein D1AOALGA4SA_5118 [Olavius algarvensis Delta 1 endosymbiont]
MNDVINNANSIMLMLVRLLKISCHLIFLFTHFVEFRSPGTIIYSKCFISTVPYILLKKLKIIRTIIVFELPVFGDKLSHKVIAKNSDFVVCELHIEKRILKTIKREKKQFISFSTCFLTDYLRNYNPKKGYSVTGSVTLI